jgi:hypothetical protein
MLAKRPSRRVLAVPLTPPAVPPPAPLEHAPAPHDRILPTPAAEAGPPRRPVAV